jgi:hypothetical protein
MTEEQLTSLLRIKRFEQPPPQYFERLLENVHRRQREELLQRPLWRIAVERVQTFFSEHSMGNVSYAGAMAAALVVGAGAIAVMIPGEIEKHPRVTDSTPRQAKAGSLLTLQSGPASSPVLPVTFGPQAAQPSRAQLGKVRRYVIDARPASYEPEASIQF